MKIRKEIMLKNIRIIGFIGVFLVLSNKNGNLNGGNSTSPLNICLAIGDTSSVIVSTWKSLIKKTIAVY